MANLRKLQDFAAAHGFGLTSPLTHAQVVQLAEYWLPEMRFYQDERFHPISLDEALSMVEDLFGRLPAAAQGEWRVAKRVRAGPGAVATRAFDPPVVHVPDGSVVVGTVPVPVVRVLNDGRPARDSLSLPDVGRDAVVTHGASFERSDQFFGAKETLGGGNVAAAGDPFIPRATDNGSPPKPRITVMAALLNLLELLKYELLVSADDDYPPDGMRGALDIASTLLDPPPGQLNQPPPHELLRQILLDLIASHESGLPLPSLPPGWRLDRAAWDAVTRFVFLEYYFFYAYNDFDRYQTAIFENEHEGDDEGCCLVFDRDVLNLAAAAADPRSLLRAVPHSIMTSVHDEYQNADLFKLIAPPTPNPDAPNRLARDVVPFTVYIAGGSHATYLTPGNHDLVDFGDTWGYVEENVPILLVVAPTVLAAAVILAVIEHFVDTEDFTSDAGVHAGPESVVGSDAPVASRVVVLPMSADNHIYQPENEELLRLRAYAGKWGGHDGVVDKSPAFTVKTGRYFRRLVSAL